MNFQSTPKARWYILIGPKNIGISFKMTTKPPHWLARKMYKILLDWDIKVVEK